jgi:superfamily II DNA or RNA helicase
MLIISDIVLRWYQEEAKKRILKNIDNGVKKQLIMMATASGKTLTAAFTIKELLTQGKKIFFIVSGDKLVMQTYVAFKGQGIDCSVIKAGQERYYNEYSKVQIIMAQTYKARLNKIIDLHCDVAFVDEIHYMYEGNTMNAIFEKHADAFIVGLSATPIDFNGELLSGFDKYETNIVTIKQLQDEKMVARDRYFPAKPMDVSNVRVKNTGDYNDKDLEAVCNQSFIVDEVVESYLEHNEGYKGIVFAISIAHAERLRDSFLNHGIKCGLIHSKMKKFQISYWLDAHKTGRIQLLINVGMLIMGYDDVNIIDMIDAQPTLSERKQIQKWGRACRMDDEGLGFARIFDYAGNTERHHYWCMERIYTLNNGEAKEKVLAPVVCFNCFNVIYEKSNKCPYCEETLKEQQEAREREVKEYLKVKQVEEIIIQTGSAGAIEALTRLLGYNANTFYYTKVLPVRVASVGLDVFNSEVIRIVNYCRRKSYKPGYVVFKLADKMRGTNT